jgi:hypothetical protein
VALARAEISTGLVFRSVLKGGRLGGKLPDQRVSHIVKHYAERTGPESHLDVAQGRRGRSGSGRDRILLY